MVGTLRTRLAALAAAALLGSTLHAAVPASAATGLEGFDPGNLVADAVFFDGSAMTVEEVGAFIAEKGAACVAGPDGTPCLKDYRTTIPAKPATAYCEAVPAVADASSAEVITAAAAACDVNPQVLLVLLQKEQALVTGSGDRLYADRYARATGLGCPDFRQCDPAWATFFGQVYGAAERFQIYKALPGNYRHKVGVPNEIQFHPEPLCGRARVTIANQATAGLYNYTPYVPNDASLAAGGGSGDLCSSYGNRNFYRYLATWFPASVPASTSAPIAPRPGSTLHPAMTAIYRYADQLGGSVLGSATGSIRCSDGTCTKPYTHATITWTSAKGAHIVRAIDRIAGPTRNATAVEVSKRAFPQGATTVFLATGTAFADALAAGPRAQLESAPILLTTRDTLPKETAAELRRLAPSTVYVVGGELSVARPVEEAVRALLPTATVNRLAGPTRYDTAVAVGQGFASASQGYVASGQTFPDALVSGPLVAGRSPLLLVPSEGPLPAVVGQELTRLGATRTTVLGGQLSVAPSVERALAARGAVERIAGDTRYETAVKVAERAFTGRVGRVYLTSGENFPDALVAVSLQKTQPGPVLLTGATCVPQATMDYLRARPATPVTLVGGEGTMSRAVGSLTPCR